MTRPRRRYELQSEDLDRRIEELVDLAVTAHGPYDDRDYVRQIIVSALRFVREGVDTADVKLINSALKELRHSFLVFGRYKHVRKISIFGSARTRHDDPAWVTAHEFARRIAEEGWMVITGAGDGIMGAAQAGAGREKSFGVNIRLPMEQHANEVIAGDHKLINFRYFFTRKVVFVKESHAIALFPGGFGTHDEGFETLTLIQTGKSELLPVVCVEPPGSDYWAEWGRFVSKQLLGRGLIGKNDLSLFKITSSVDEAVREVLNFYSNFHSSRFVHDRLVLRVRRSPSDEQLDRLNVDFADIVDGGRIHAGPALPEEDEQATAHYPRVYFRFNRRDHGRLRQMVDRLNSFVAERSSPPVEAVPQEIREGSLTAQDRAWEEADADGDEADAPSQR